MRPGDAICYDHFMMTRVHEMLVDLGSQAQPFIAFSHAGRAV
jgi:hypothetical protein